MDILRLVTFTKGGRPVVRLDLNDGTIYTIIRDTMKFDAPERQQQWSDSIQRYEGSVLTNESQKNAQFTVEWYISGSGSADTAGQRLEALMVELESLEEGRYIEWRPEGMTRSVYFPIRGPSAWEFLYRWIEFQATKTLHLKAGWTIAPLAEGDRMFAYDDFSSNSLGEYTFNSISNLSISGGTFHAATTSQRTGVWTTRSDKYSDAAVTQKITTGANVTTWNWQVLLKTNATATGNQGVYASINQAGSLAVGKIVGGVQTPVNSITITAPSASTSYWLRLRTEGNSITAEWFTSSPNMNSTPVSTVGFAWTGGDITAYGAGVQGYAGFSLTAGDSTYTLDDLTVEPFCYSVTAPNTFATTAKIPGDAPAKCDVVVGSSGTAYPFALLAWTRTPTTPLGGTSAPFGVFEAESATTLSGLTSTADGSARGGNCAQVTASGAGSGYVQWSMDPSTLTADDFGRGEVDIEVWGRAGISSSVVQPVITVSAFPASGLGATRYTQEYSSLGKAVNSPSSGSNYRLYRLGTITLPVDTVNPAPWSIRVTGSWFTGSSGVFKLDYVIFNPVRTRACSPTNKANDSTYPRFIPITSGVFRRINWDLTTSTAANSATPGNEQYAQDVSLAGSRVLVTPGNVTFLLKLSDWVPDDPSVASTGEAAVSSTNKVSINCIPRYFLPRGT
jgi:hypothetical protein